MNFLKQLLKEKDHAGVQFFKYVTCGGLAVFVDYLVFYSAAIFFFPALTPDDIFAKLLGLDLGPILESVRLRNYWVCISLSFVFSNIVAYLTNVCFVFKGGKHKVHHEVALFFAVSLLAFGLSSAAGDLLIRFFALQTSFAKLTAIVFGVLINYSGRKFFIFHG